MQESIFDLFGSRHTVLQKQNSRQATSVSSVHSLGKGLAVPSNFKQKSLSVGGPTPLKRALGDVGNRIQLTRPHVGNKEESQKPLSISCLQKSPSLLPNGSKTPSQKSFHNGRPGLKDLSPTFKNLSETYDNPTLQIEVESKRAVDWNDLSLPEILPDPELTEIEDDYEDFFLKSERLTSEDIYRVVTHFVKAKESQKLMTSPDLISLLPLPDVTVEDMQPFEVDLLTDIVDEQVSLPDLLWDIRDKTLKSDCLLRHTL